MSFTGSSLGSGKYFSCSFTWLLYASWGCIFSVGNFLIFRCVNVCSVIYHGVDGWKETNIPFFLFSSIFFFSFTVIWPHSGGRSVRRKFEFGRTYVVRPKGKHQATIVWLHGLGDNGSRWYGISYHLKIHMTNFK